MTPRCGRCPRVAHSRQRALDALAERRNFAADGVADAGDLLGGDALRFRQSQRDLGDRGPAHQTRSCERRTITAKAMIRRAGSTTANAASDSVSPREPANCRS